MSCDLIAFKLNNNKLIMPWLENCDTSLDIIELKGIKLKYKDDCYIITTAHNLTNNIQIYLNGVLLNLLYLNKDFDICILKENDIDESTYTDEYLFDLNISDKNIFINDKKLFILNFNKLNYSNISILGPPILLINCFVNDSSKRIVKGDSGTGLINNNNKYIGIISRYNPDNSIDLIPLIHFKIIIDNNFKNNFTYFPELTKIHKNKLLITSKSNQSNYNDKTKKLFKKNDILISIDNLKIDNGNIFCKILNINIPFNYYILLFNYDNISTKITITRKKKEIDLNLLFKSYNKYLSIPYTDITNYTKKNNVISIELNIDLFEYYFLTDISKLKSINEFNFFKNIQNKNKIFKIKIKYSK